MLPPERPPVGLVRDPAGVLRPRRAGWIVNRNRVTCPAGHRVEPHRNLGAEVGYLECARCRALLVVLQVPAFGGTRRLWAADCTAPERDWWTDQGLTADQVIAALGAELPVVRSA